MLAHSALLSSGLLTLVSPSNALPSSGQSKATNMAEPISSVRAALACGDQLNTVLLLWHDMSSKLAYVVEGVLASSELCTMALRPLQEILAETAVALPDGDRIFTLASLEDIESLATKCNLIHRAVILLFQKAAETEASQSTADKDTQTLPEDGTTDLKTEIFIRPVPDLSSMKIVGLISKLRSQRREGWLYQRLEHCADQLLWIHRGLLVHLQIARHARM